MLSFMLIQLCLVWEVTAIGEFNNCFPGELSTSTSFSCDLENKADSSLTWMKDTLFLSTCVSGVSVRCTDNNPVLYQTTWSNGTSYLTIKNISIESKGIYSCIPTESNQEKKCDFKIYTRPELVTCQDPEYLRGNITVKCTAQRVYPAPLCQYSLITNNTVVPRFNGAIEVSNGGTYSSYYNAACILTLTENQLGLGIHQLIATIYPNVTGLDSDAMYGEISSVIKPVNISWPTVQLNAYPTGYILEGSMVNCTCIETSNSFVLAKTSLYQGATLLNVGDKTVSYTFVAKRDMSAVYCQASILNSTSFSARYQAQIAYGPSRETVNIVHNKINLDKIDLCDKTKPVILNVNCTVNESSVFPGVSVSMSVNETLILSNTPFLSLNINTAGPLLLKCKWNNSAFSNVSTSKELSVIFTEPPLTPPYMYTTQKDNSLPNNRGQLSILEGEARIRCSAEGGFPSVSNMTVQCSSRTTTSQGSEAFLDLRVDRSMDGWSCTCTGRHVSSCSWNNTVTSFMDVHFNSTIVSMKLNDTEGPLIVTRNSVVKISCLAEGNPSPIVSITKDTSLIGSFSKPDQKFNLTLEVYKSLTDCKDTGLYVCQAGEATRILDIYVKCVINPITPDALNLIYTSRVNSVVSVKIPVYGYPEPNRLELRGQTHPANALVYTLKYVKGTAPFGNIELTLSPDTDIYFQNYTITVTNTEGSTEFNLELQKSEIPSTSTSSNVGAIVGSFFGGMAAMAVIGVVILVIRRKGDIRISKQTKNTPENRIILERQQGENKEDASYANLSRLKDQPKTDPTSPSHYDEISTFQTIGQSDSYMNSNIELSARSVTSNKVYENTLP